MIETKNLSYSYDGIKSIQFPDISMAEGAHGLLLGQSGSGKTTLLHLLGGLLRPQKGSIIIANTDITHLSPSKLDAFRGQKIGIVFQKPHFIAALTVEENLVLAQKLSGVKTDKNRMRAYLERLGVAHKTHAKTTDLSAGEAQRISLVRALVNKPNLILADEPTAALDDTNTQEVLALLKTQAQEAGATLLIVTHDARLKAAFSNQFTL
jgi:ABC-type lipoprotein export system ATPase subunit